jgi:hypothetical protein
MAQPQNPLGAITWGRDWNFFQKVVVTADGYFNASCDIVIPFTTQAVMMLNLGSGVVEMSFNGNTVHGELNSANPSAGMAWDNRVISKIWLRVQAGSSAPITVSVMAWPTS